MTELKKLQAENATLKAQLSVCNAELDNTLVQLKGYDSLGREVVALEAQIQAVELVSDHRFDENAALRSLGTTMSDSFDKVSDECMRLKAQLGRVKGVFQAMNDVEELNMCNYNYDLVDQLNSGFSDAFGSLDDILSTAPEVLESVDGFVGEWDGKEFRVASFVPCTQSGVSGTPVTAIIISREESNE